MVVRRLGEYDRKPLVLGLCETKVEFCEGIVHAKVRDKGILISLWGSAYSYLLEFYEGKCDKYGNFYVREHGTEKWELVYDSRFYMFFPHVGLFEEKRRTIRFTGEYPPFDRSITLGKHVIILALFEEGLGVLRALGKRRIGMIRRIDGDKDNHDIGNLYLHIFYKYQSRLYLKTWE